MSFSLERFAATRPYLFHLTHRSNLANLLSTRRLLSAAAIMRLADDESQMRCKRPRSITLTSSGVTYSIRDQQPLYEGNVGLEPGWTFEDLVQALNERVFFWPGRPDGRPIPYGVRHFERYAAERPVIARFDTRELFAANAGREPLFCRFNSGSPRYSGGKPSPRGDATFVAANRTTFLPSKCVEVTFAREAVLPRSIEVAQSLEGPWQLAEDQ